MYNCTVLYTAPWIEALSLRTIARGKQYRDVHKQTTNKQLLNFTKKREREREREGERERENEGKEKRKKRKGRTPVFQASSGHTKERGIPEC